KQRAGNEVGCGDHRLASDGIEQAPDGQGAEKISDRKWKQVQADTLFGDPVELDQDERIGEEDGVIKERLRRHQDKSEDGSLPMFVGYGVPDFAQGRVG